MDDADRFPRTISTWTCFSTRSRDRTCGCQPSLSASKTFCRGILIAGESELCRKANGRDVMEYRSTRSLRLTAVSSSVLWLHSDSARVCWRQETTTCKKTNELLCWMFPGTEG